MGRARRSAISISKFREGALTVGRPSSLAAVCGYRLALRAAVPLSVAVLYALGKIGGLDHIRGKREPDRRFSG
jgi:hypothetical protein